MDTNKDTFVLIVTHDPKIDDDALKILLNREIAYIGALGSKKTHKKRCQRLKLNGFNEEKISFIKGPAGVDINAKTAAEIAISMIGEVISVRRKFN